MTKKIISGISKNYATALFDKALSCNGISLYEKQLEEISQVFKSSNDLDIVLSNSAISTKQKLDIIDTIFINKIDNTLLNFIKILIEKGRYKDFETIKECFTDLKHIHENKKKVEITSAIKLNDLTKTKIIEKLKTRLKSNIIPNWKTDENIIAGLIYKFDDYVIDTSIKSKLENLSKILNR